MVCDSLMCFSFQLQINAPGCIWLSCVYTGRSILDLGFSAPHLRWSQFGMILTMFVNLSLSVSLSLCSFLEMCNHNPLCRWTFSFLIFFSLLAKSATPPALLTLLCPFIRSLTPLSLPSYSHPQSEAESDPCGLAQRRWSIPLQRCHHFQNCTHCHPETGLLQRFVMYTLSLSL